MIEVINLSITEALSLYMRGLKSQTYEYISLEDPDKLYNVMKIAEKFDVIKFGIRTKDSWSNSKGKKPRRFNNRQDKKEFNALSQKNIDLEQYKREGRCF